MATILITGGTGFIGSNLAMRLLERDKDTKVVLFDRSPDLFRLTGFEARYEAVKDRVTFVQGDLTILPHVLALFDAHTPDSVFHLGALLSAGAETNPTMGFQTDTVGSWHVFEAARLYCQHAGSDPIRVIFPSTIASFGSFIAPGALVNNEAIQMPTTMYGVSKVSVERLGEYYSRKGWIDFRAVRFPSVIGASRGPGGTTVYSTLMIQEPFRTPSRPYIAYVAPDTRLDIVYISEAVDAIVGLHDAAVNSLKPERRVYNIAGMRTDDGQAPTALDIKNAVVALKPDAVIDFQVDPILQKTVTSFGVLKDEAAQTDWGWKSSAQRMNLAAAVAAFRKEVNEYPKRIKSLELFGA
jgi:nucleoside-diphosphate-sugar epimerase